MAFRKVHAALAAIVIVAGVAAAQSAAAAIMLLTYTGVVGRTISGEEAARGAAFALQITYDTSRAQYLDDRYPEGRILTMYGTGAAGPILSAQIAIEGHAPHQLTDIGLGFIQQSRTDFLDDIGIPTTVETYALEIWSRVPGSNVPLVRLIGEVARGRPPVFEDAPFEVPVELTLFNQGLVNLPDLIFLVDQDGYTPTGHARVERIAAPVVVPEPASWALLIAGFGLSGVALRRRRFARQAKNSTAE